LNTAESEHAMSQNSLRADDDDPTLIEKIEMAVV
jgi:hypothetical protein